MSCKTKRGLRISENGIISRFLETVVIVKGCFAYDGLGISYLGSECVFAFMALADFCYNDKHLHFQWKTNINRSGSSR